MLDLTSRQLAEKFCGRKMKREVYLLLITVYCYHCFAMSNSSSNQNLINTAHPVGEFLRVAIVGVKPYLFLDGRDVKGSDLLLIQLLSKKLNFNYNLSFVPDFDKIVLMVKLNYVIYSTCYEN